MLYSRDTTIRIHIHAETKSTIMMNEHTSLEKYTSHTLFERVAKGLCVRGELETEQTATYWPQVPLTISALLSHSTGLFSLGSWGPKPSAGSWFSLPRTATRTPTNWLPLWHRVISLFDTHLLLVGVASAPNLTRPYVKVISSTGCTYSSNDGWVEGQYVTTSLSSFLPTVKYSSIAT